ncbi:hypothetical protein [Paenibacillus sp. yr247]|nr:hypothetical protein [Paenibacillus sp. yr247]
MQARHDCREIAFHLDAYKTSGAELIMGSGRFAGPKTIEVLNKKWQKDK